MSGLGDDAIARVVHEAARALQIAQGEPSTSPPWDEAADWMRASTLAAVRFRRDHPEARSGAQHEQWMAERLATGWRYGPVKDADLKTHPSLVPFADLPIAERRKDALVIAVIDALLDRAL